ncbi:hypothetical protein [Limnoglobus roseus]|uniref:SMI1/KNR4 family protein n=1 Tax=Limnoglobus roseus TaxID=2598579 RepID=A0A5C1A2F2_9BACT|nr:hypothetical protein [Limnoglobus roseus]QEL13321.1 hypothetical protein PX52LOC_00175 [Limnoglobus roseus]
MAGSFAERYRKLLADITGNSSSNYGYSLRAVETAEVQLGLRIPDALRDYYLSVGRHELNHVHNRILSPDDLSVSQRRLVFQEENQCVLYWGVRARTTAVDPMVFQTMDFEDGDWVAETRCSQFLPGMLCWYATGSMPHAGYSDQMDAVVARRLMRGWPLAGRSGVHSAFVRNGQVVCVEESGAGVMMSLGTRSSKDFKALVSELGIGIHER